MPLSAAPQWIHDSYSFAVAVLRFSIVFSAFAANVLCGAMRAVPNATDRNGRGPWDDKAPNILANYCATNVALRITRTEQSMDDPDQSDAAFICFRDRRYRLLGPGIRGVDTSKFTSYPHGDWRMQYFLALLVFCLALKRVSEFILDHLTARLTFGQAIAVRNAQKAPKE